MHAAPIGGDKTFCEDVEGRIGGPGGIWLDQEGDVTPPSAPQLLSTDPASPSLSGAPRIRGAAEAGSTVRVYAGSGCTGAPVATGSAAELSSPGITVAVAEGATAAFSATATDAASNVSTCSGPISYTRLKAPPACIVPKLRGQDAGAGEGGVESGQLHARQSPQAKAERQKAGSRRQVIDPRGGDEPGQRQGQPEARAKAPKSAPLAIID